MHNKNTKEENDMLFLDTQVKIRTIRKIRNGVELDLRYNGKITFTSDTADDDCTFINIGDDSDIFNDRCFIYLDDNHKLQVVLDDNVEKQFKEVYSRNYFMIPVTRADSFISSEKNIERTKKYAKLISNDQLIFVEQEFRGNFKIYRGREKISATIEYRDSTCKNTVTTANIVKSQYVTYLCMAYGIVDKVVKYESVKIKRLPAMTTYVPYVCMSNGTVISPDWSDIGVINNPIKEAPKAETSAPRLDPVPVKKEEKNVLKVAETKPSTPPSIVPPKSSLNEDLPNWSKALKLFTTGKAPTFKLACSWNKMKLVPSYSANFELFCDSIEDDLSVAESYSLVLDTISDFEVVYLPNGSYQFRFHTGAGVAKYIIGKSDNIYITIIGSNLIIDRVPYKNSNGQPLVYAGMTK